MTNYALDWMRSYRQGGLLLDTNLLVLYVVGLLDPARIPTFKRTKKFAAEDYTTLVRILGVFDRVITTPHILAEVSNLGGQLPTPLNEAFFAVLAESIAALAEVYVPSVDAIQRYPKLGLTDSGIIHLASQASYFVLTDDFPLANYLATQGIAVLNFEHVRTLDWT